MGLRPLRCEHCGSTRIRYVRLGHEDEVALCSVCHGVTEPREVDEQQAKDDLVLQLQSLRRKAEQPEPSKRRRSTTRKKKSSGLGLVLSLLVLGGIFAGLFLAREALISGPSDPDRADRLAPVPAPASDRMLDTRPDNPPRRRAGRSRRTERSPREAPVDEPLGSDEQPRENPVNEDLGSDDLPDPELSGEPPVE